ncbi:putative AT hook motif family protein [Parachaetomium inaequale]|uniref:AT hook motif family protein n=1 Tax=Parachaetomium inaequale TaxID=2588326 RepID=A0AAN6PAD6_9PEZI|nr:putative AT hook motif family protein [Parachaetomium inaequale]
MADDAIVRDGFTCRIGRFFTNDFIERVDGARLKAMFLPRLTREAKTLLRDHPNFIRAQLQHYGVDYDEAQFPGKGTWLLKEVLQEGKCDRVPDHIKTLRAQMHSDWLEKQSDEELSDHPKWIVEKYRCQPDATKTTRVVGTSYPRSSIHRSGKLRKAAGRVAGLHEATGWGSTQTIYLGWDQDAVNKAAKDHAAKEARANKAKADAQEAERASNHATYLRNAQRRPSPTAPVGQYMVDCQEIESKWSDRAQGMILAIHPTHKRDIYQASFDFGVIEGIMMLGSDESILDEFCAQEEHDNGNWSDYYSDKEDDEKEDDNQDEGADEETAVGSKRKATAIASTAKATSARPRKKAKAAGPVNPREYFVRLKSRDNTGTGEVHPTAEKGTITFNGPSLSSFTGKVDMAIGRGVSFTARKISAVPTVPSEACDSWASYSEAACERARVGP